MIEFLKKFFSGEQILPPKKHDVIALDAYAMNDDEEEEEEQSGGCGSGGCGSCGCG